MSKIERARQKRFDSAEAHAFLAVVVVAEHFSQAAGDLLMRHGITAEQYNVLRNLAGIHPQAYSRREIASRLVRKSPDVTRLLDRVEREGLVERSIGSDDRRLSLARITRDGLALLDRVDPEMDV